ncbi:MAG: hypothetical protein IH936_16335 [Acidobacteria bacterium]|nr:hypothetical protein [Acidobacteriota bacterium]
MGQRIRERTVPAWDLGAFETELKKAKKHLGLEASAGVVSCYEAGREGFTLDRYLAASGILNAVVDAGSLEVKRRRLQVSIGGNRFSAVRGLGLVSWPRSGTWGLSC